MDGARYSTARGWSSIPNAPVRGRLAVGVDGALVAVSVTTALGSTRLQAMLYDVARDTWRNVTATDLPEGHDPAWAWTGQELCVFVFSEEEGVRTIGACYAPASDIWSHAATSLLDPLGTRAPCGPASRPFFSAGTPRHAQASLRMRLMTYYRMRGRRLSRQESRDSRRTTRFGCGLFIPRQPTSRVSPRRRSLAAPDSASRPQRASGIAGLKDGAIVWGGGAEC